MSAEDREPAPMSTRSFRWLVAAILAATGAIVFHSTLAPYALETHEVFVAQSAREMITTGEFIVPMFGGEPRLQKPPLMYWAVVAVATITGHPDVPPWVARFPSALATMALIAACIGIGARVYDRRTGLIAGAMLGSCAAVFEYGSNARPEMLYAACTAVMTYALVCAARAPARRDALRWAIAGWLACGLAFLTKGPQLPGLIILGLSFWHIRATGWKSWARALHPILGLCIVSACVAPWFIAVILRIDGAPSFWANELIGLRFASAKDATGGGALTGFFRWLLGVLTPEYLAYAVAQLLPWGLLLPLAFFVPWQRNRPDLARGRDLFFAMIVPLLVLSLASRSREYYLLPMLPIIAVLLARGTIDVLRKGRPHALPGRVLAIGLWIAAGCALASAVGVEAFSGFTVSDTLVVAVGFTTAALIVVLGWRALGSQPALRPIVVALLAWGAAFGVLGQEPALWDDRADRIDDLAIAAVALAADTDLPVIAIGFDPDDLIYRFNRPIQRLPRASDAEALADLLPAIVVASPETLDRLATEGLAVDPGLTFAIEDGDSFRIATVRPGPIAPPAPTDPAQ